MSVKSAAVFKSLCRLGFKVDLSISRDIHQAIEHTILWEEMNALVSERFRVSFTKNFKLQKKYFSWGAFSQIF